MVCNPAYPGYVVSARPVGTGLPFSSPLKKLSGLISPSGGILVIVKGSKNPSLGEPVANTGIATMPWCALYLLTVIIGRP